MLIIAQSIAITGITLKDIYIQASEHACSININEEDREQTFTFKDHSQMIFRKNLTEIWTDTPT